MTLTLTVFASHKPDEDVKKYYRIYPESTLTLNRIRIEIVLRCN